MPIPNPLSVTKPSMGNAATRYARIVALRAQGKTLRQIAPIIGVSFERIRQILLNRGTPGRTLMQLPGTEALSSITRGTLVRMGYTSPETVVADVTCGKLYAGCSRGIGPARFAEIDAWARNLAARSHDTTQ